MKVFLSLLLLIYMPLMAKDVEVSASVNWLQEVVNGGVTSGALAILCLVSIGILAERFHQVKMSHFAPQLVIQTIEKHLTQRHYDRLLQALSSESSLLARVGCYISKHHKAEPDMIFSGASDIVHRTMRKENQINNLLAVSAALAPLLGLLGTMIGMIESFKLVELYGDEGGASMLAGSISKALITTAVGLIIAIFSLVGYHYFRLKISSLTIELEEIVDNFLSIAFLKSDLDDVKGSSSHVQAASTSRGQVQSASTSKRSAIQGSKSIEQSHCSNQSDSDGLRSISSRKRTTNK